MNEQKKAIVLGGTYPHIELINQLKIRGYYVVLIDYLDYSPAIDYADEHLQESTLDKEKVLSIAESIGASLITATCVDQANVTACYVSEKLGLPKPYSYKTACLIADKATMKAKLLHCDAITSKYLEFHKEEIASISEKKLSGLNWPLVLKPADGNGSKGVIKVDNFDNLIEKANYSASFSRNHKIIIEEYIQGIEIGVDLFIKNKTPHIIMTRERMKKTESYSSSSIQQISGSYWPAEINSITKYSILEQTNKIIKEFNLDNCPLLIQGIVHENKFHIIEFAPRIGGGDNYDIINIKTKFNIIEASVKSLLGENIEINTRIDSFVYYDMYLYGDKGKFNSVSINIDPFYKQYLHHKKIYKKSGTILKGNLTSSDRIGVLLFKGKTRKIIREIIKNKLHVNISCI